MNIPLSLVALRRRRLAAERLEVRRCLAASLGWDGPGQGSAELSYYVGSAPSSVGQAAFESAIETALQAWSDVIDIEFTEIARPNQVNALDFTFETIDGPGGTLAQAYLPDDVNPARVAGDVEFDVSEPWEIGNAQGRSAFDLVRVAAHEIGHSLGIDHLDVSGAVLAPFVSAAQRFTGLTSADIDAALRLYASAPSTPPAPVTPPTPSAEPEQTIETTSTNPKSETTPVNHSNETETSDDSDRESDDNNPETTGDSSYQDPRTRFRRRFRRWAWWFQFDRLSAAPAQHNAVAPSDVNEDGRVTSSDALAIINQLVHDDPKSSLLTDSNGDGEVTTEDALFVINEIARDAIDSESGEGSDHHDHSHLQDREVLDGHVCDGDGDETEEMLVQQERSPDEFNADPYVSAAGPSPEAKAPELLHETDLLHGTDLLHETDLLHGTDLLREAETSERDEAGNRSSELDDGEGELDFNEGHDEHETHVVGDITLGHAASRLFDLLDTNTDKSLDDEELPPALLEGLRFLDVNADGLIGREELPHQRTSPNERRFQCLDDNLNGEITEEEVNALHWQRLVQTDGDANERIDVEEWKIFLASQPPRGFRQLDDNGDGVITVDEVNTRLWKRLSSQDEDGNQAIEPDEFDTYLGRRPERFTNFLRRIRHGRLF